jgi:DNA-binding MarR family transcriptional regulator
MLGQDIALLLKLCLLEGPRILSKKLSEELFLSPADVSKSLNRCRESGLLY